MNVPTPTLDPLLGETVRLLNEARQMVACIELGLADDHIGDLTRLEVVGDCTRMTARLTAVLAWLLAQKAVAAGEFPADDDRALMGLFGCGDPRVDPRDLPTHHGGERLDALAQLVGESGDLFLRVARLDRTSKGKKS